MLAGILFLLLLLIPAATAQTAPVDENQTYILDFSMLPASDYNNPLNGVYLVAPNGSGSLPAQLSYYYRPGGPTENLSNNATAATPGGQPLGDSAWQSTPRPANDGKVEILIHPDEIFGRTDNYYTLSDIQNLSWYTHKPNAFNSPDWYINIWLDASGDAATDASSNNIAFLSGEPYWSNPNGGTYATNT